MFAEHNNYNRVVIMGFVDRIEEQKPRYAELAHVILNSCTSS